MEVWQLSLKQCTYLIIGDMNNLRAFFTSVPFDQKNPLTSVGCTPLHFAVLKGFKEIVMVSDYR